ncbi:MAG: ABC transporter substrate-binding protein [Chloroflexota bacterium]|nr:MAG: ABC transporter substrate-binding protein [Chloroflexota bacterium]
MSSINGVSAQRGAVSRRRFLRGIGLAAAAPLAIGVLQACAPAAPPTATAKPVAPAAPAAAPTNTTAPAPAATKPAAAVPAPTNTAAAAAKPAEAAKPTAAPKPAAAPAPAGPPSKGAVVPTPRNQTVVLDQGTFFVFDSFNPFIPNGQQYNAGYQQVNKEFLFYANYAAGKIEPWLGQGWKYNVDFSELQIQLNPRAKFNDGTPLTSKDIKFGIEMFLKDAALIGTGAAEIRTYVASVTTSDDQNLTIKLKTPNPRFHYIFICGIVNGFEVIPESVWSKIDPKTFKSNPPIRTGPYKLDRVIPDQFMFVWKKDPNYWNKSVMDPAPEYVVYRSAPVVDSSIEEFKRGQSDLAGNLTYPHMKQVKEAYAPTRILTSFRDPCPRAFWINSDASKGILADSRMRWALSYLTDRKKIGQTIWLIETPPAQYPWADYKSNDTWANKEIGEQYALTYDPKKAAALLDEMGAVMQGSARVFQGKPISLEIMTPAIVGNPEFLIGQSVVDELKKLGVDATVRSYTNPIWTQKWNTGEFDISSHWLCGVSFDPGQLYAQYLGNRAVAVGQVATNGNQVRLKSADFDALAGKVDVADPTNPANKALFDQTLAAYYKALPAFPIIQTTYPVITSDAYWTGWPTDDNNYQVPLNWWGQYGQVIGRLKPTGKQ